ncbi:LuxR C-terminal-related transcriptional regulator [Streptomyces gelaticus]
MDLIEREKEFRIINKLIDSLGEKKGGMLIIDGFVASGKTSLLQAAVDRAENSDIITLTAAASALEREIPLGLLGQLMSDVPLPLAPRVPEAISHLRRYQGSPTDHSDDRASFLTDLLTEIYAIFISLMDRSAILVAVDDLHHSDVLSLSFLLRLARGTLRRPALLVFSQQSACMRGHQLFQTELRRLPHCHHVHLAPLSPPGVGRVLARHLDPEHALRVAPAHHELSGGSPLLVQALLEDQKGVAAHTRVNELLPAGYLGPGDGYRQAVTACLHRGSAEAAGLAHALAVLHETGSEWLADRLLDTSQESVVRLWHVLTGSGLLSETGFRHPAVREAVLEHIPPSTYRALHLRTAHLLHGDGTAPAAVATHLLAAGQAPEAWSASILREAAEQVLGEDRMDLAQSFLELALCETNDPGEYVAVTLQLARTVWRRSPDAALRHIKSMTDIDPGQLDARQGIQLIKGLLRHGMFREAQAMLVRFGERVALPSDEASGDLRSFWLWLACSYPALTQRFAERAKVAEAALPREAQTTDALLQATTFLHTVLLGSPAEQDITWIEQELQLLRLSDETLEPLGTALTALIYADRVHAAARWCTRLLAEAHKRRVTAWIGVLSSIMAEISLRTGDLQDAEEHAQLALSCISTEGWGVAVGPPQAARLAAATARGDLTTAHEIVTKPMPQSIFHTRGGLHYQQARGHFHLALDHPQAALREFESCGTRMREWGLDRPSLAAWRTDAAQALLKLNQPDEARQLAEEQLALLGPSHSRTHGMTLRTLAAAHRAERRAHLLERSVQSLEEARDRLELARALADLSRARGELGDHAGASDAMARALQEAGKCRAEPLVRALQTYGSPGVPDERRRLAPVRRSSALSESERRVARLVAKGLTNREVATQLFVTVSTVEQHLTNIYRKLRVSRRGELRSIYSAMN